MEIGTSTVKAGDFNRPLMNWWKNWWSQKDKIFDIIIKRDWFI